MRLNSLMQDSNGLPMPALAGRIDVTGLTCDSRKVEKGFLFAALPGGQKDGRDYIADAVRRGAAVILAPPGTVSDHDIPILADENPRRRYAKMAAQLYSRQPKTVVAVTGTDGKSSVVHFLRELWILAGQKAASIGTLGVVGQDMNIPGTLTTPDPADLHRLLRDLGDAGIDHLALEASSHGLDQHRLDGVVISAAAFTNLGHDHLDYHKSRGAYLRSKERLFSELLAADGTAVLNADMPQFRRLSEICSARNVPIIAYGRQGKEIRLMKREPTALGQRLELRVSGHTRGLDLPLLGAFQAENVLAAMGLALACGADRDSAVAALAALSGVPGRLQRAGATEDFAVYVDYAHTPGALETVLSALRPHVTGSLALVFGCGGDRDVRKRPMMGRIAARLADRVTVTDDNPRNEDPAAIRAQILRGCPDARETGDRARAITEAVRRLGKGDVLLIAGKGHERGQIIGATCLPFDDVETARAALGKE